MGSQKKTVKQKNKKNNGERDTLQDSNVTEHHKFPSGQHC